MRRAVAIIAALAPVLLAGCSDDLCSGRGLGLVCLGYSSEEPNRAPVAAFSMDASAVRSGAVVRFDASASSDDVLVTLYEWDLNGVAGDGPGSSLGTGNPYEVRTTSPTLEHQVLADEAEIRTIGLRVTDSREKRATAERTLAIEPVREPVNLMPAAVIDASPNPARRGEVVRFDASRSSDPEGGPLRFDWDLDGDGGFEITTGGDPTASRSYDTAGTKTAEVMVTDPEGLSARASIEVEVRKSGGPPRGGAAGGGRAFSARLTAYPLRRTRPGALLLAGGLHARFGSRAEPPPALRALLDSRVVARLRLSRSRLTGLAIAAGDGALACARVRMTGRGKRRRPAGSFRLLGGRGSAARLRASGSFSYDLPSGVARLGGRIRSGSGPPRELPPECVALLRLVERG